VKLRGIQLRTLPRLASGWCEGPDEATPEGARAIFQLPYGMPISRSLFALSSRFYDKVRKFVMILRVIQRISQPAGTRANRGFPRAGTNVSRETPKRVGISPSHRSELLMALIGGKLRGDMGSDSAIWVRIPFGPRVRCQSVEPNAPILAEKLEPTGASHPAGGGRRFGLLKRSQTGSAHVSRETCLRRGKQVIRESALGVVVTAWSVDDGAWQARRRSLSATIG
jgi:hypothetical protein